MNFVILSPPLLPTSPISHPPPTPSPSPSPAPLPIPCRPVCPPSPPLPPYPSWPWASTSTRPCSGRRRSSAATAGPCTTSRPTRCTPTRYAGVGRRWFLYLLSSFDTFDTPRHLSPIHTHSLTLTFPSLVPCPPPHLPLGGPGRPQRHCLWTPRVQRGLPGARVHPAVAHQAPLGAAQHPRQRRTQTTRRGGRRGRGRGRSRGRGWDRWVVSVARCDVIIICRLACLQHTSSPLIHPFQPYRPTYLTSPHPFTPPFHPTLSPHPFTPPFHPTLPLPGYRGTNLDDLLLETSRLVIARSHPELRTLLTELTDQHLVQQMVDPLSRRPVVWLTLPAHTLRKMLP